jgi:hypothetical protein
VVGAVHEMIDPAGSLPPGKRQANEQTNKQSNWRSSIKHRFHRRAARLHGCRS